MKNILKGALVALLMLIIVSCSFSEKEADVYATVDTPTVIYGTVGTPNNTGIVPTITITLHNGTLSGDLSSGAIVTTWVQNLDMFNQASLLVLGTHTKGTDTIRLYFNYPSATSGLMFTKATTERMKIQIPADFIQSSVSNKDRLSPVVVNTDNLRYYSVLPNSSDPIGRMISSTPSPLGSVATTQVGTSGLNIANIGKVGDTVNWEGQIELENTTFKASDELKAGKSIKGWFSPEVKGIDYIVKEDVADDSPVVKFTMTGTVAETKPQTFYTIKVPGGFTKGGKDVPVNNLANAFVYIQAGPSKLKVIEPQDIKGTVSKSEDTVNTSFVINAFGGTTTFNALSEGSDVSSWFHPLVPGLKYTASAVTAGTTSVTVSIKGAPERSTVHDVEITVPVSFLNNASEDITVDGAIKYNIEKSTDFDYSWKLYDLASFGASDLSSESPNKALTKAYNGTDELTFGTGNMLASGETAEVSFLQGLSRRGYKLAGFNRIGDNGIVRTRTEAGSIDFEVGEGKDVTIGTNGEITFNLKETDKGDIVSLYAIWDVDLDVWSLKRNTDGTYNTTLDISLNADGKNEYLPAVFDVKKAYPDDETTQALYNDYPYYRESLVLSKGLKSPGTPTADSTGYSDLEDVIFSNDFAIGEQMVTGYMIDVLREWNKGTGTDASPEKGYELPTEAVVSAPSGTVTKDNNTVAYGTSYATRSYLPNNEKSDPITHVTVAQGIVISNALTAYYNEKKTSVSGFTPLTFAYIKDGGTDEIKTIADANTLVAKSTAANYIMFTEGSTGFRLPTQNEWTLASRIVPESGYDKSLTGAHTTETGAAVRNYMYPQIHRSNMWSGSDVIASGDNNNSLSDTWVWNYYSVSTNAYRTTHGFRKASKDGSINNWTVLDKKPNNIGVYGMSGNLWEWCDTTIGTGGSRRLRGGSFTVSASYTRVGYLGYYSPSTRVGFGGLRLARSV